MCNIYFFFLYTFTVSQKHIMYVATTGSPFAEDVFFYLRYKIQCFFIKYIIHTFILSKNIYDDETIYYSANAIIIVMLYEVNIYLYILYIYFLLFLDLIWINVYTFIIIIYNNRNNNIQLIIIIGKQFYLRIYIYKK